MILWRNIEIIHFYHFDSDPRFLPFLLYVRWKSRVTFVRGCFRDGPHVSFFIRNVNRVLKSLNILYPIWSLKAAVFAKDSSLSGRNSTESY